ncbi:TonB family protein [Desulfurobacterium thermolithotrophum DSM 11699]|uniref:TonB family protein n=1 Tax=Desulfurobacterium thermolithotrophum (strain DSM 11699 / BSA) TaxID=868864 RepID=F0S376_DESTD|nr:energy transducer TonB [Desulfurobacterium thermolithotrophum]ADY73298.1 TonB family protein [Desulfurobacterium thermolithotrophum DSM 11699]
MAKLDKTFLISFFVSLLLHIPFLYFDFHVPSQKVKKENIVTLDFSISSTESMKNKSENKQKKERKQARKNYPKKVKSVKKKIRKKVEKKIVKKIKQPTRKEKKISKEIIEKKNEIAKVKKTEKTQVPKTLESMKQNHIQKTEKSQKKEQVDSFSRKDFFVSKKTENKQTFYKEHVFTKSFTLSSVNKSLSLSRKKEFDKCKYIGLIIEEIEKKKFYPRLAKRFGIEGKVILKIVIDRKGNLESVSIVKTSGSKVLDKAALKLIKKCKFPPLPPEYKKDDFEVEIPIRYELR